MNSKKAIEKYLKDVAKPARYIGGELNETIKNKEKMKARFAFCFPDTYEIGMSNLGMKILYGVLNSAADIWCERCFAPWDDMGKVMKEEKIPLYALESGDELRDFDFVGFTLQYEMSYTNVLYMLSLANIPLLSSERDERFPIIVGGGPCAYNPEPVADFFDLFSIGEGEETLPDLVRLYIEYQEQCKAEGKTYQKSDFLLLCAEKIKGAYVPSLYDVRYHENGVISGVSPKYPGVPNKVLRAVVPDFETAYYPEKSPLPYIETVHDRIMLEAARGCPRGCRFCQAGMIYRPYRSRSPETLNHQAFRSYKNTGYEEISLTSLSISDYPHLSELVDQLKEWTDGRKVGLSLPSMRIDNFENDLMQKVQSLRKSGLTFAPEAGSQRLRDIINKNITEDEILSACRSAFYAGRTSVKLYFMVGLPGETDDDIRDIAALCQKVVDEFYKNPNRQKKQSVEVTLSVACFVPKPNTAFQWEGQNTMEELIRKQKLLGESLTTRKVRYHWHEAKLSFIEAVFARGDRRLSKALLQAHNDGIIFDGWDEFFSFDKWMAVFEKTGIDPSFYANRTFSKDEVLAWSHIDCGISEEFLKREAEKSEKVQTTPDCNSSCSGCGAAQFGASICKRRERA